MTAAEFGTVDGREVEVLQWRLLELLRAGCRRGDAVVLTAHRRVDLHHAIELARRGCAHTTALRILL